MTTWAPNSPDVLGSEWLPTEQGFRALNANSKAAAIKLRSDTAENIEEFAVGVLPGSVQNREGSNWWVEVFEDGNEIPGAVSTTSFAVAGIEESTSNWANQSATTFTFPALSYANNAAADAAMATALDSSLITYIQYRGTYQAKGNVKLEFNTAAWPAGRRVVGGRIVIVANRAEATGQVQVDYRYHGINANYTLGTITVDQEIRTFEIPFPEVNPAHRFPWEQTDITDLQAADASKTASIRLKPLGIGKNKPLRIYEVRLELDWVDENRVCVAIIEDADANCFAELDSGDVLARVDMSWNPWAKADNTTYTYLLRRVPKWADISGGSELETGTVVGGQIGWQFLRETQALGAALGRDPQLPDPYMASYEPTLNSDGTVASMGDVGVRGYAIVPVAVGGTMSPTDGQPYHSLVGVRIADFPELAVQELTTPGAATGTYEVLRVLAFSDAGYSDEDGLSAEILRVSDGTLMGSTGTADFADAQEVGTVSTSWEERRGLMTSVDLLVDGVPVKLVEVDVGAAGLANATQYFLHLTGYEAGGLTYGCGLVAMRALGQGGYWGGEGFAGIGGTTDNFYDAIPTDDPDAYADQLSPAARWFDAWRYTWSVNTTDNDPGVGTFKANSSTISAITRINIDDLDDPSGVVGSQDHSAELAAAAVGTLIIIHSAGGEGIYRITAVSDPGTYVSYSVTYLAGAGTMTAGAGGHVMLLSADRGLDAPFQLVDPPAAPTNFATTVATQTLATPVDGAPEFITSLEYVDIAWTATALVGNFGYYEIQRSEDGGTTWAPIARITDEAVEGFRDYEGRRNVEATYRMRVWTTFATSSDWTATSAETPLMDECALLFTSNEDPDLNLGFVDVGGERRYTFQSADEREFHSLVGRNYQVVTSPLEYRGDAFEVTLAIQAGTGHASVGREVFDSIEAMSNAAVSYICVLDETGRRWFADVAVAEGRRQGNIHEASARIVELTDAPSLVDVAS